MAPPSEPDLDVANVDVAVEMLGTDIVFYRVTDEDGRGQIETAPMGNVAFDSHVEQDSLHCYGQGNLFLQSDIALALNVHNVEDLIAGVPPPPFFRSK